MDYNSTHHFPLKKCRLLNWTVVLSLNIKIKLQLKLRKQDAVINIEICEQMKKKVPQ